MTDTELLERIVLNPKVMAGKPVIQGTRLTVDYILNRLAHGATEKDLLDEYPGLLEADIRACYLSEKIADAFIVATEKQVRFGRMNAD